jgi:hypothetical protein
VNVILLALLLLAEWALEQMAWALAKWRTRRRR